MIDLAEIGKIAISLGAFALMIIIAVVGFKGGGKGNGKGGNSGGSNNTTSQ